MKLRILFLLVGLVGLVSSAAALRREAMPREPRPGDIDLGFGRNGLIIIGGDDLMHFDRGIDATRVNTVAVDPSNGDIFAGGFLQAQARNNFAIWKFNARGVKDENFGARGAVVTDFANSTDEEIKVLRLLPSSKILAGGVLTMNGRKVVGFARYNSDGTPDAAFGQNGKRWLSMPAELGDIVLNDLIVDPDGRLIAAGSARTAAQSILFLARLLPHQRLDNSFNGRGYLTRDLPASSVEGITAVAQGEDGTIFVGGYGYSNRMAKFLIGMVTSDGRNSDFMVKDPDSPIEASIYDILVDSEGRLLVAGDRGSQFALARYLPNGDPDRSFGADGMTFTDVMADEQDGVHSIHLTRENKIMTVGAITRAVDNPIRQFETTVALAQYNNDGSLDESFGDHGIVINHNLTNSEVTSADIAPTNNIVVGSTFQEDGPQQGLVLQHLGSAVEVADGGGVAPGAGVAPGGGVAGGGAAAGGGGAGGGNVPGIGGGGGPAGAGGGGCMLILK